MVSWIKNGKPTLCDVLNFGKFPQYFSPNLDIVAVRCAGKEYGVESSEGVRFLDNKRLDGTIQEMIKQAIAFVGNNTKTATKIDENGNRADVTEYPIGAIREILLNALIHRDYSIHTENDPIRLTIYDNRIEITNPGGLYGRLSLNDLGKVRADIRNPFIASALETLNVTENRYSGIPMIYAEMRKAGLKDPKFEEERGTFKVTLYNEKNKSPDEEFIEKIKKYCSTPKSKEDIARYLGFDASHPSYCINTYILSLIEGVILAYTIPGKPKSKNQKIHTVEDR